MGRVSHGDNGGDEVLVVCWRGSPGRAEQFNQFAGIRRESWLVKSKVTSVE